MVVHRLPLRAFERSNRSVPIVFILGVYIFNNTALNGLEETWPEVYQYCERTIVEHVYRIISNPMLSLEDIVEARTCLCFLLGKDDLSGTCLHLLNKLNKLNGEKHESN